MFVFMSENNQPRFSSLLAKGEAKLRLISLFSVALAELTGTAAFNKICIVGY